ncbi:Mud2p PWA37_003849 [Arxiozyma heterogenica]|uniref:RNA recognition motif domain-containing protein n=1 Tax=Arxiozyma heterogenica TaxID=278026 RepID=A0AAN7ZRD1_9SACH|nr:hypothetical protein RI543_004859 [Kazachstania heterogenica]
MSENEKTLEELRLKILSSIGKSSDTKSTTTVVTPTTVATDNNQIKSNKRNLPPSQLSSDTYKSSTKKYKPELRNSNVTKPYIPDYLPTVTHNYTSKELNRIEGSNQLQKRYQKNFKAKDRYSSNNVPLNEQRNRVRPNLNQRYMVERNNSNKNNTYYNNNNNNNITNSPNNIGNNNSYFTRPNKRDPNYVLPAFRDKFRYNNATCSKLNCKIVINDPLEGKLDLLRELIEMFLVKQKENLKELYSVIQRYDRNNPIEEDITSFDITLTGSNCILTFDSFQSSTLVLSCRSFFNRQLGLPSLMWSRLNSYIEFGDHIIKLCSGNIITIENVSSPESCTKKYLSEKTGNSNFEVYPIYSSVKIEGDRIEKFTNCVIIVINTDINNNGSNLDDRMSQKFADVLDACDMKWFKPNKSEFGLRQRTSKWLYSDIVQLVQSRPKVVTTQQENRVLLLLNCVDPMDLKDNEFVEEIHDTLLGTLDGAEKVKIIQPGAGYRLNLSHISDYVGCIFVQFKDSKTAQEAQKLVSGTEFNGRTVICSQFNESDFETLQL